MKIGITRYHIEGCNKTVLKRNLICWGVDRKHNCIPVLYEDKEAICPRCNGCGRIAVIDEIPSPEYTNK